MDMMTIGEAAKMVRRTVNTLQRWDRDGVLKAGRTKTNRRYYTEEKMLKFLGVTKPKPTEAERRSVAYLRVSSPAQRPDLKNQRSVIEDFCVAKGLDGVEYVEEIKGGLNFERPKFGALMDAIEKGEVSKLIIAHKDRLCRFGYKWFERHCRNHGCKLLVLNTEKLSPEQEMVQDLMTIIHCFSSRLYGLRNYRKALKNALKGTATKR
jgi:predicted site-specific integrase-resolvase